VATIELSVRQLSIVNNSIDSLIYRAGLVCTCPTNSIYLKFSTTLNSDFDNRLVPQTHYMTDTSYFVEIDRRIFILSDPFTDIILKLETVPVLHKPTFGTIII
jgi:hypothetical protein